MSATECDEHSVEASKWVIKMKYSLLNVLTPPYSSENYPLLFKMNTSKLCLEEITNVYPNL